MKKLVAFVVLTCSAMIANAQVWVGGSLGFDYSKSEDVTYKRVLSFAPTVGFALNDRWDVGVELGYGRAKSKTEKSSATVMGSNLNKLVMTSNSFEVEPFVRYSMVKMGIVTLFLDGSVFYGHTVSKSDNTVESTMVNFGGTVDHSVTNTTSKTTQNEVGFGVRPGIKVELGKHIELESHLGYLRYTHGKSDKSAYTEATKYDKIGLSANNSLASLGVIWKF